MSNRYITPDEAAQIEQSHNRKAELLTEMRQERQWQYLQRHQPVGLEIARALGDIEDMAFGYRLMAQGANTSSDLGKPQAANVFASLAQGFERAAFELEGAEGVIKLAQLALVQTGIIESGADGGIIERPINPQPGQEGQEPIYHASFERELGDDEHEPGVSLREAVSPEIDEAAAQAARARRKARHATTLSAEA
jgi:hypothetical protein